MLTAIVVFLAVVVVILVIRINLLQNRIESLSDDLDHHSCYVARLEADFNRSVDNR